MDQISSTTSSRHATSFNAHRSRSPSHSIRHRIREENFDIEKHIKAFKKNDPMLIHTIRAGLKSENQDVVDFFKTDPNILKKFNILTILTIHKGLMNENQDVVDFFKTDPKIFKEFKMFQILVIKKGLMSENQDVVGFFKQPIPVLQSYNHDNMCNISRVLCGKTEDISAASRESSIKLADTLNKDRETARQEYMALRPVGVTEETMRENLSTLYASSIKEMIKSSKEAIKTLGISEKEVYSQPFDTQCYQKKREQTFVRDVTQAFFEQATLNSKNDEKIPYLHPGIVTNIAKYLGIKDMSLLSQINKAIYSDAKNAFNRLNT